MVEVTSGDEARAALESVAAGGPYLMHVTPKGGNEPMIQLVYGRAERAMLVDPYYDYGSIEPDRTRLSAAQARRAVAEFVDTGRRPTCVSWLEQTSWPGLRVVSASCRRCWRK